MRDEFHTSDMNICQQVFILFINVVCPDPLGFGLIGFIYKEILWVGWFTLLLFGHIVLSVTLCLY